MRAARQRLGRDDGRRRAPSTRAAGCSSRTASSRPSAAARRRRPTSASTWAAPSSRRAWSTRTTTCTRPSRARGRSRRPLHVAEELYPVWARLDAEAEYAAARTGLAELALSGCTTVFDHHYVFPRGQAGWSRRRCGGARARLRIVASRGSMDLGESQGGLPPDALVEDARRRAGRHRAARRRSPDGARVQIAVAPCSPFSVTARLMEESAALARGSACCCTRTSPRRSRRRRTARALRLPAGRVPRAARLARRRRLVRALRAPVRRRHRHVRRHRHGRRPLPDLEPPARRRGRAGAASCSTPACASGSASTARRRTSAATSFLEVKQALLVARGRGGPEALTAREAIRLGTRGGAAVLRRDDIGSLEPGKCADFAVWRTDGLELGGADDPVAGARLRRPAPRRPPRRRRRGGRARRAARHGPTRTEIAREHRRAGAKIRAMSVSSRPTSSTPPRPAGRGVRVELYRGDELVGSGETDADGRIAQLADGLEPGSYRARLPPAVAVLPPRRARGRARRRPLPRAAPRLALLVRELPRQLTVDELAELFEGRTRLVERLAEREDPLGARARGRARARATTRRSRRSPPTRRSARRASSAALGRRAGPDDDPAVLAELAELNAAYEAKFGFRFVVFVNRRPSAEILRSAASGSGARAKRSSRPASTSSSRSPRSLAERLVRLRCCETTGSTCCSAGCTSSRRSRGSGRRSTSSRSTTTCGRRRDAPERRRRRDVGDPRRRLLPRREVPRRARRAARAAALVQVGGVHDLDLGLRAARRPLLRPRRHVPRSTRAWPTSSSGAAIAISLALLAAAGSSTTALCRLLDGHELVLGGVRDRARRRWPPWAASELFAPRAAFLQVGAMLGTIMVANVFFVIIPATGSSSARSRRAASPTRRRASRGKQRSMHNNYLTLPVLFAMLAEHFPITYAHEPRLGRARRADGRRRLGPPLLQPAPRGTHRVVDPASAASSCSRWRSRSGRTAARLPRPPRSPSRACRRSWRRAAPRATRCIPPTRPSRRRRPGSSSTRRGTSSRAADAIDEQAVRLKAMPLGNLTHMTEAERGELKAWIDAARRRSDAPRDRRVPELVRPARAGRRADRHGPLHALPGRRLTWNTVQRQRFAAEEVDEVLEEARSLLRSRGRTRTQWEVGSAAEPPGLVDLLLARGLARDRPLRGRAGADGGAAAARARDHGARRGDVRGVRRANEVQWEAFEMPDGRDRGGPHAAPAALARTRRRHARRLDRRRDRCGRHLCRDRARAAALRRRDRPARPRPRRVPGPAPRPLGRGGCARHAGADHAGRLDVQADPRARRLQRVGHVQMLVDDFG